MSTVDSSNRFKSKKVYCRKCKNSTNHRILSVNNKIDEDDEYGMTLWTDSFFLQCLGCECVCLLIELRSSEDCDLVTSEIDTIQSIFPNPYIKRTKLDGFYFLPIAIQQVYEECISGFNNNLPIITSIGLRLIIESICKDFGIHERDLYKNIEQMASKGFITENQKVSLHLIRDVGNSSAHDLLELNNKQLNTIFDIVDNALSNAYIIPKKAEKFRNFFSKLDVTI